jgi:hypothetical protein
MGPIDSVAFEVQPRALAASTDASLQISGASPAAFDVAHFNAAYAAAAQPVEQTNATEQTPPVAASDSPGFRSVIASLGDLNDSAESIGAAAANLGKGDMRPSDMLQLTMKAQEFMFHCEVTANVANRTSDGVQQLFQQQS